MAETPRQFAVLAGALGLLVLLPAIAAALGRPDFVTMGSQVAIMAIAAAGLDLLMGRTGLPSFGHAAWLGLGGYAVAILAAHAADRSLPAWVTQAWFAWPVAILVPGVIALGIGALCLRTRGISFIMITLAFAQMFFFLFIALAAYGGDDGLSMRRRNALPGIAPRDDVGFYYVCVGALLVVLALLRVLAASRFGAVLTGIRQNERRMVAIGLAPFGYKLAAFVIAAGVGGLAGALHVNLFRFASPDLLHWTMSGELMVMVVLGGLGSLWGAVFGAAALVVLHSVLAQWTEHWQIVVGPILVAVVLLARRGVWGALGACGERAGEGALSALLEVRGLRKRFGGLVATDRLDLDVAQGEIHALIGPNGAGKTTAIGQLAGELLPDAGTIRFAGADITGLTAAARVRAGMTRSFQITQLLGDATALANVALAEQVRQGHSFRFWRRAAGDPALAGPALAGLERVGLAARADTPAAALSHGERRQLELAVALATRPRLLLLDEPMAGLGASETAAMTALLVGLRGEVAMLLVEHDMDAVFALADRITVLLDGRAIASGIPAVIRADPAVRDAYLGTP